MDKQIEIQKMQQEIFDSCAWRFSRHPEDYREVANDIGEDLYNLGYRNCKDKVVLTQKEYERLCDLAYFGSGEETIRKETAREIFSEIYLLLHLIRKQDYEDSVPYYSESVEVFDDKLYEIEKKYGVEEE